MKSYSYVTITFMASVSLLLGGCGKKPAAQSPIPSDAPKIKVAVFVDGHITADGSPATVDSLRESFEKLAEKKGVVLYYREAGLSQPPPPQATEIIKAVVAARLPIQMSSLPDYSDFIGSDGKSHPLGFR